MLLSGVCASPSPSNLFEWICLQTQFQNARYRKQVAKIYSAARLQHLGCLARRRTTSNTVTGSATGLTQMNVGLASNANVVTPTPLPVATGPTGRALVTADISNGPLFHCASHLGLASLPSGSSQASSLASVSTGGMCSAALSGGHLVSTHRRTQASTSSDQGNCPAQFGPGPGAGPSPTSGSACLAPALQQAVSSGIVTTVNTNGTTTSTSSLGLRGASLENLTALANTALAVSELTFLEMLEQARAGIAHLRNGSGALTGDLVKPLGLGVGTGVGLAHSPVPVVGGHTLASTGPGIGLPQQLHFMQHHFVYLPHHPFHLLHHPPLLHSTSQPSLAVLSGDGLPGMGAGITIHNEMTFARQ
ncbi:unnamed protein product [Protopolystoma xenopodis]|uniref:Uncharacterized protein n=1 Tax=Protopolystoma xenopodis TaxID=117903 RepID=A0A3S5AFV7_9PLAT|nr:unnamed protein product [Protopolystoma xenopodis]